MGGLMRAPGSKILPREELASRLAAGPPRTVVLANGLFDLCHVGHARYLAHARSFGDVLVLALNDDRSARENRGPSRPLLPLEERLVVAAAFLSVDDVTWFPERSVAATLELLRPRYHAKGTDYRPDTLPADEQEVHARLGIEVVIAGDPKDHATTGLIEKIIGPRR
jgi:D-glycero-beta-D-manno-heptose 1-phosphate adenylyltransferase